MNITYNGKTVLAIYRNGTAVEQALIAWNWTPTQLYFGGVRGAAYVPDPADVYGPNGLAAFGENIAALIDEKAGTGTQALGPAQVATGWVNNSWSDFSTSGSTITATKPTAGGTAVAYSTNTQPIVAGTWYQITMNVIAATVGFNVALTSTTNGRSNVAIVSGTGLKVVYVQATTTGSFTVQLNTTLVGSISVENVSVRQVLGNDAFQSSVAGRPLFGRAPLRGKVNVLASSNPGTAPKNITGTVTPAGIRSATVVESTGGPFGRTQKKLISNAAALVGINDHTGFSLQTPTVASPYTLSFIAKPAELDGLFVRVGNYSTSQFNVSLRLSDGVIYNTGGVSTGYGGLVFKSITELTDGFKRYEYTYTLGIAITLTIRGRSVSGLVSENDGVNGVYLDMVQLEAGSTSTTYQEVTSAVDTVESSVTSFPFIRLDLSDDTLVTAGLASTKNLTRFSEEFDNAAWVKTGSTVVGKKIVETATTGQHIIYQASLALGSATISVDAKADGRDWLRIAVRSGGSAKSAFYNLATGVVGTVSTGLTASIQSLGSGVYRCIVSGPTEANSSGFQIGPTTADNISSHTGDGVSGITIDRVQTEAGSVATAYEYGGFKGTSLVAGRNGTAVESVTLPDGNFTLGPTAVTSGTPGLLRAVGDILGYNLINKTLTAKERKYLIQYYKDRGAKGMLVPGPELITNGDFSNGLTGWTVVGGDGLAELGANGVSILRPTGGFDEAISTAASIPTVVGRSYLVQFRITEAINGPARIEVRDNGGGLQTFLSIGVGTHAFVYTEASSGLILQLFNRGAGQTIVFNNISLKELRPEEEWV